MIIKIKKKNVRDSLVRAIRRVSPLAFPGYSFGGPSGERSNAKKER